MKLLIDIEFDHGDLNEPKDRATENIVDAFHVSGAFGQAIRGCLEQYATFVQFNYGVTVNDDTPPTVYLSNA